VPKIKNIKKLSITKQNNNTVVKKDKNKTISNTHTHTTVLKPFFWDDPGEPVPEEKFWTLRCKGKINRGRRTDHPAGCHSIWMDQDATW